MAVHSSTTETANKASGSTGTIARSAGAVSAAVMCSRVLGLVREQIFAGLFGAGFAYDAFVVAFRIPNLLRDLFGEGALSAAFVTVFTEYSTNRSQEETWQLASTVLTFFAIFLSIITLLGIIFANPIVSLLAPDFSHIAGKTELTTLLTRIMFPFLLFVALAAVVMGILNTRGRFFIPALSSAFFNLGSIIGGVSLAFIFPHFDWPAIAGMACGTLIGGLLQLLIQLPSLLKLGFTFTPTLHFSDPGLKRILTLMLPATIGLSATQVNIFVNTNFASSCVEGSVSWLNYAFRMVQLPIGVFGVAFSIAAMPVLARCAAKKDMPALRTTFTSSLLMIFSLTIPATAGLIFLSEPIIRLIFQHGAFTPADTLHTAAALQAYAYGLFAYSSVKIMVPVFYALEDTKYPVIGSFLAVGTNIVLISLTIERFQYQAIALSTSCVMILNFFFLGTVLYRKLRGYDLGHLGMGIIKIFFSTLVMCLGLQEVKLWAAPYLQGPVIMQFLMVFLLISTGAILYGGCLHLLRLPELELISEKIRQRFH